MIQFVISPFVDYGLCCFINCPILPPPPRRMKSFLLTLGEPPEPCGLEEYLNLTQVGGREVY